MLFLILDVSFFIHISSAQSPAWLWAKLMGGVSPFSGSTVISFSLSRAQIISLNIFDVDGRLVTTLADKLFDAGENEIVWDASEINAGVYFAQVRYGQDSFTKKVLVFRK